MGRGLGSLAQVTSLDLRDPCSSSLRPVSAPLRRRLDVTVIHLYHCRVTMRAMPPKPTADKHRRAIAARGTQHREETGQFLWHPFITGGGQGNRRLYAGGGTRHRNRPPWLHRARLICLAHQRSHYSGIKTARPMQISSKACSKLRSCGTATSSSDLL